jgi:alpha-L-fucosidase
MRRTTLLILLVLAVALAPGVHTAQAPASATPLAKALAGWQDMRFGLFIHWGPVSLTGHEIGWSRGAQTPSDAYDALYTRFNPVQFNADEWARAAKDAGMKYVVFTAKHHDGFCMWDTKTTDYNITRSPFGRDVVRELSDACRSHGLVFCTYYSILDWRHPDYPLGSPAGKTRKANADMNRYAEYLKQQVSELVTNYGPLAVMWFDGEWEEPWSVERGTDLYAFLRRLQPSLIINNRVSKARAGMEGTSAAGQFSGDYDTPEQRIGGFNMGRPWESCMTICEQWAWKPDDAMKPLSQCLRTLVSTAGGNGNLLFNVGPMPDGRIEPRQVERLKEMGAWLRLRGESVYGTRGGPFKPGAWGASTRRGTRIYLHVFAWDGDARTLPAIPAKVTRVQLLGGARVEFTQTTSSLTVRVPAASRDPIDTVIALDLDRPAMTIAPVEVGSSGKAPAPQRTR